MPQPFTKKRQAIKSLMYFLDPVLANDIILTQIYFRLQWTIKIVSIIKSPNV